MPGTLHEVDPRLWVGEEKDCILPNGDIPMRRPGEPWGGIVHAAKYPCHAAVVGYAGGAIKLTAQHPEYLWAERPAHLVMNLIDPPVPLFKLESFTKAIDFLESALDDEQHVLIHCNAGLSRAPSLALVYLAKRRGVLPDDSFSIAREVFLTKYPRYQPGQGHITFLTERWAEIR